MVKTTVREGFYLHLHDKVYNPGEQVELSEAEYHKRAHLLEAVPGLETTGSLSTVQPPQLGMDLPPELEGQIISRKPPAFILEDVGGDPKSPYKTSATVADVSGVVVQEIDPLTENVSVTPEETTENVAPVETTDKSTKKK